MASLVLFIWAYIIMACITAPLVVWDYKATGPSWQLDRVHVLALAAFWPWTFVISIVVYLVRKAIHDS